MSKVLTIQKAIKVIEQKGQARTTSRNVAEFFSKRHDNVLQSIKNLECSSKFRLLNFQETKYKDSQNKIQTEYFLTKDGFAMLAFGFTGKEATQFKEDYIEQFNAMESLLRQKQTEQWKLTRNEGKLQNSLLTDTIKQFVSFAYGQGSLHADNYYKSIQQLANKTVGITDGQRDYTEVNLLSYQMFVFQVLIKTMRDEMVRNTPYKQVYKNLKSKAEDLRQYIPQTQLMLAIGN